MKTNILSKNIKNIFLSNGFDMVGFTNAKDIPDFNFLKSWISNNNHAEMKYLEDERRQQNIKKLNLNFQSVISCAINYNTIDKNINSKSSKENNKAWISRYALIDDYHKIINKKLKSLMEIIKLDYCEDINYKIYVDTGPLLERAYSYQSGLGWFGKNSCLINKDLGSWFFISEVLINKKLEYDQPVKDMCGSCTKCIDSCPTGAIVDNKKIDANKCISYLTIENKDTIPSNFLKKIGNNIYGCDICQEVCPWNSKKAKIKNNFNWNLRDFFVSPELDKILQLIETQWDEVKIKSPIKRAKKRGFLRNILIAMGNSKNSYYKPKVQKYLKSDDKILATTAKQAILLMES